jgi:PASTA domain
MTNVAETAVLVATGPSEVELKADGDPTQPTSFSGSGTYTVSNKGTNRLTVLMSGRLAPVPVSGGDGAQAAAPPANASVKVTPPRVVLDPGANAQAKADVSIPPGTQQAKAMLEVLFRDEQKPNEIYATYTSSVEVPESKKPTNWKLILLIVAIVLVVLIGAGIAFFLLHKGGGKTFAIPTVKGKTVADATKTLQDEVPNCKKPCFKVETAETVSDDAAVALGNVIGTDPADKAKRGDTVKLQVMKGVEVPDVGGFDEAKAKDTLTNACAAPCFTAAVAHEPSFSVPVGVVTRTAPAAKEVEKKGTAVTVFVSNGFHELTLPASFTADLDDNIVGGASSAADLWFSPLSNKLQSGFEKASDPTAFFANFVRISPKDIGRVGCLKSVSNKAGWVNVIPLNTLSNGTHICDFTSEGAVDEVLIQSLQPTQLVIRYVVWRSRFRLPGATGLHPGVGTKKSP